MPQYRWNIHYLPSLPMIALSLVPLLLLSQGLPRYPGDRPSAASTGGGAAPISPTFACYGDSIMAGACSATSPCVVFGANIPGSVASNEAVSGYTAAQILACYNGEDPGNCTGYATACNGAECATVLLEGGVNTLKGGGAFTGEVEAQTVATMLQIVDHALARGRRVAWVDVLPYASCSPIVCGVPVDAHVRATTYNTLKSAACATRAGNPLLHCITAYADFEGETEGHLKDAYACESDGIHLKQAGSNELACKYLRALGYTCP